MARQRLTAGVLGLNKKGQQLLTAAEATGDFDIIAVADQDHQRVEKTGAEFHCDAYTDYRQLIVQHDLDCLLVAADTHVCDEQIKAALKKKFLATKKPWFYGR